MICLLCRSPGVEMVDLKYCHCVLPFIPCRAAETIDQMLEKLLEYVDNVIVSQGGGCFKFSYTDVSLPFSFPPSLPASLLLPFSFPLFLFPSSLLPSPPTPSPSPSHPPTLLRPKAGKIPPNSTVGRLLMETISRVPKFDGPKFDAMLNSTMQASAKVAV